MENSRVIRSAFLVGGFTTLSRFLGLARDVVTATAFGTSAAMSDFVVAFSIPNMFRALFGEGALASAFVPLFTRVRAQEGGPAAWQFTRKIVTLLSVALALIVAAGIGVTFALQVLPGLIHHAPQVMPLLRIMLPYLLFICLTALSQGILNSYHRFALPAFTPCLLNLTWIGFVLFVCPRLGATEGQRITGVAWGVLAAGLVQLGAQVPLMLKLGYRPGLAWDAQDPKVRQLLKLMAPTALGQSVSQVNMTINRFMARWANDWASSSMYYAERMLYFPQGILATALSTVLLPVFSGHAATGDHARMRDTLNHSLRSLLFIMIPAAVGLFALAQPILQAMFGWGKFDVESLRHTTLVLQVYAPGLLFFGLAKVFVPAFYALQDTRTPYRNGLYSVGINFTLNVIFTLTLPHDLKAASLALAAVVAEAFNGLTLGGQLGRRIGSPDWSGILRSAGRSLVAAALMGLSVAVAHPLLTHRLAALHVHGKTLQFAALLPCLAFGVGVYLLAAWLLRCPEIQDVRQALAVRRQGENTA
ncbi:MAG: murein biosynthesis integral membrane protein MurJ [Kiritimatiellaeota bacterium]|nr:murein biosynthesis integral membrane protein MurJ [Kiritimatiellota bacterium]